MLLSWFEDYIFFLWKAFFLSHEKKGWQFLMVISWICFEKLDSFRIALILWSYSLQNSLPLYVFEAAFVIFLYIQKNKNACFFVFPFLKLITNVQDKLYLELQLQKHFNTNYTPLNKLTLLSRRVWTLRFRGSAILQAKCIRTIEFWQYENWMR